LGFFSDGKVGTAPLSVLIDFRFSPNYEVKAALASF